MTQIIKEAAKLYNERYKNFGSDIRTVGWKDKKSQELRFEILTRNIDLDGKTILDVGCGKGFMLYDLKRVIPGMKLKGIDISEYAIENCKDEVKADLLVANAIDLPFEDKSSSIFSS